MIIVPGFLLRRLYAKGSLRSTVDGFQFTLKNNLGSGYGRRMLPIAVDGEETALEAASFEMDGETVPFTEVSQERPFTLAVNRETVITVRTGVPLSPGAHRVRMGFEVQGLGTLSFDFTDAVGEG